MVCAVGVDEEFGVPTTPAQLAARIMRTITSVELATRCKIAPATPELNSVLDSPDVFRRLRFHPRRLRSKRHGLC
jgi:hypothetical protein